jgi:chromosome segregation ATPase
MKQVRIEELKRAVSEQEAALRKERAQSKELLAKLEKTGQSSAKLEILERDTGRFIKGLQEKVLSKVKELFPLKEEMVKSGAELEAARNRAQAALKILRDKKAELHDGFAQEKADLMAKVADLEVKLQHKEDKLKPKFAALESEQLLTSGLKQQIASLEIHLDQLQTQEKANVSEKKALTDQYLDLQGKVETAQYELVEAQACEEKFEEWERITAERNKITNDMDDMKEKIENTKQIAGNAKQKRAELEELKGKLEAENSVEEGKVAETEAASAELAALKSQIEETSAATENAMRQIAELEELSLQQASLVEGLSEGSRMIQEEIDPLVCENEELRKQNIACSVNLDSLTREIATTKEAIASKAEQIASLEAKITALERAPKIAPPPSSPCSIF